MVDIQQQEYCQKAMPYIDCNAMKIELNNNYFVDILNCIIQLLTEEKYTTNKCKNGIINKQKQLIIL